MNNVIKSELFTSQYTVINREVFTILWAKVGILPRQETKRTAIGKKSLQKEETRIQIPQVLLQFETEFLVV